MNISEGDNEEDRARVGGGMSEMDEFVDGGGKRRGGTLVGEEIEVSVGGWEGGFVGRGEGGFFLGGGGGGRERGGRWGEAER